jgi:hypothetical protein
MNCQESKNSMCKADPADLQPDKNRTFEKQFDLTEKKALQH